MRFKRTPDPRIRKQLICEGFNFSYAGRLQVYLTPRKSGYSLVRAGFSYDFDTNTVSFNKEKIETSSPMPLYIAIQQFMLHVQKVLDSGLDWYSQEAFDFDTFFREKLDSIYY